MEIKAAHLYILLNCPEVDKFISQYKQIYESNNYLSNFSSWFYEHVSYYILLIVLKYVKYYILFDKIR
ncbi:hypothetical protein AHAS_Ahas19G0259400 [Arachis hypogaea]